MSSTRLKTPTNPKYSILIGVYGHFEYLKHCIDSVLDQPKDLAEIIIIDDGSPDCRVIELLKGYAHEYPQRIQLHLHKQNKGIIKTWNEMVKYANGEYLVFLDCDDFLSKDALITVDKTIEKNPRTAYVFSDRNYVDVNEKVLETSHYALSHEIINHIDHSGNLLIEMIATHLKVIKKQALIEVGGFSEESSGVQDYDIALKISEKYPMTYISSPLYNYRIHPNTVTNSRRTEQHIQSAIVLRGTLMRRGYVSKKDSLVYLREATVSSDETSQFLAYQKMGIEVIVHVTTWDGFMSIIPKIGLIDRVVVAEPVYNEAKTVLGPLLQRSYIVLDPLFDVPV